MNKGPGKKENPIQGIRRGIRGYNCENCIDNLLSGQFDDRFFVHFDENNGKKENEEIHIDKTKTISYYKFNLFINSINE